MISPLKLALTPSLAGGFYGNTKKRLEGEIIPSNRFLTKRLKCTPWFEN